MLKAPGVQSMTFDLLMGVPMNFVDFALGPRDVERDT